MMETNEQARAFIQCVERTSSGKCSSRNCQAFKVCLGSEMNIKNLAQDLLEARELIKEMREELEDARTVMEKYEAQLTGELFNDPSLNAILEKTKEYAE